MEVSKGGQNEGVQEKGVQKEGGRVKEAYKASTIPFFQVIQTKNIDMAAKIPQPAFNGTSPFYISIISTKDFQNRGEGQSSYDLCTVLVMGLRLRVIYPV